MRYVFDSSSLINLFQHYYPERFPSLWEKFDDVVENENLTSVKEVFNEVSRRDDALSRWVKKQKARLFLNPTVEELHFVADIFKVKHFQGMIRKKMQYKGSPVADPFVIARAKILDAYVITEENYAKNSAKIPNVCKYFNIRCINLEGFMSQEDWVF